MRDLAFPVLPPDVVSDLTGLPPQMLRRWAALGVFPPRRERRRSTPAGPRTRQVEPRYSWREVEQLQRASRALRAGRAPLAEVRRLLGESAVAAGGEWIMARPRPLPRKRRRRVVVVAAARSARRRSR